jgi:hypothetical protein
VWALLHAVTGSWQLATNLMVLGLVGGNLAATYALAHHLVGRRDAAVIAALGFGFSSYVFAHTAHLQMLTLGLLPWAMLLTFRIFERPRLRTAITLGLVSGSTLYLAAYYAPLLAIGLAVVVGAQLGLTRFCPGRDVLRCLAIAGVIGAALVVPVARAYVQLQHDPTFRRGAQPGNGLAVRDLVSPLDNSYVYRGGRLFRPPTVEHSFFPGLTIFALGAVGLVGVARARPRPRPRLAGRRYELQMLVLAGVVAGILAKGDVLLGHRGPFWYLRNHVPGLDGIRVPARFGVLTLLALAMLAAWGYTWITQRWSRGPQALAAIVVAGVVLVELAVLFRSLPFDSSRTTLAAYHALAHRPGGVVLELPMADSSFAAGAFTEAPRMAYATIDWHPRVNGYSGFMPPGYLDEMAILNLFPDPTAVQFARDLKVRYVLLHIGRRNGMQQLSAAEGRAILAALPPTMTARRYGNDWLINLNRG